MLILGASRCFYFCCPKTAAEVLVLGFLFPTSLLSLRLDPFSCYSHPQACFVLFYGANSTAKERVGCLYPGSTRSLDPRILSPSGQGVFSSYNTGLFARNQLIIVEDTILSKDDLCSNLNSGSNIDWFSHSL